MRIGGKLRIVQGGDKSAGGFVNYIRVPQRKESRKGAGSKRKERMDRTRHMRHRHNKTSQTAAKK